MTLLIVASVAIIAAIIAVGFWLDELGPGCFIAFVAGVVLVFVNISFAYSHYNERAITCTVTGKDRGGDDGSYRIYTEDCGQLANTDSLWRGKWDSADVWQQIEPGHTYELRVVGWRAELFSDFPNVLEVLREVSR